MANQDSPNELSAFAGERFLRLPEVLERIPVSKSTWWQGVKEGRFPQPLKLSTRTSAWLQSDIDALIKRLSTGIRENAQQE